MTAVPSTTLLPLTGDPLIDAATNGTHWVFSGSRTITWSFANGFNGEFWNNEPALASGVSALLSTVSYYANIGFSYTGYYSNPTVAYQNGSDITFSLSQTGILFSSSNVYAEAFFPSYVLSAPYVGAQGDFFVNIDSAINFQPTYAPGSLGWFVVLHEIGHALGLKHPHDDGGTGHPTLAAIGLGLYDQDWFTVMSYNESYPLNNVAWHPATYMIEDVLALQYLYGPNLSTNSGDTTFTLPINNFFQTIWDPTGNNVIDVSASPTGWTIYLPNTQLSTLVSTKAGAAIPNTDINLAVPHTFYWLAGEITNVKGSSFSDTITGTDGNDVFTGGGGNDYIDGGLGHNTAVYLGSRGQYAINASATSTTISDLQPGRDGIDTLKNIEFLQFVDKVLFVENSDNANIARLYSAALDRPPDLPGLIGWEDLYATKITSASKAQGVFVALSETTFQGGNTSIAGGFTNSTEFQNKYGQLSDPAYVTQLYQNVLNRAPDPAGINGWLNVMQNGDSSGLHYTREMVLVGFAESPENIAKTGADWLFQI